MGAYLSQPKTDKVSTDELNEMLMVGASSMQGWRNSQEDAHNSILNFDTNTSLFAVYDGHGGAEVATYCADKLPQFLKELAAYKDGELEKALREAFLGFDKTLLKPHVVEILKILAGEKNFADSDSDAIDEDDEDLAELQEESNLPLNEVLEKYKGGGPSMPALKRVKDSAAGGSKPQSPYLRGRRAAAVAADAANKAVMDPEAHPEGSSTSAAAAAAAAAASSGAGSSKDAGPSSSKSTVSKMETDEPEEDSTVSSSSSSASKSNNNNNNNAPSTESTEAEAVTSAPLSQKITTNGSAAAAAASSSSSAAGISTSAVTAATVADAAVAKSSSQPDSSHVKESEQNGSVTSSEAKPVKADVSTSSSAATTSAPTPAAAAAAVEPAAAAVAVKSAADEGTVSGSNDTAENKQNGNVVGSSSAAASSSSSSLSTAKVAVKAAVKAAIQAAISSTRSKEAKKTRKAGAATGEEDSTDDDADYDAANASPDEHDDARHALEYSSDEEDDDEEDDEENDEDDENDEDEDEDDEEEENDEDEDEESAIANEQFCANMIEEPGQDSGCTAVVALLNGRDLYVANAGDSRCVVCRNGKAIEMSLDHKPEDDEESARIIKAGGRVTLDGRVNGGLNLSRAIGDHAYKLNMELPAEEQMIAALPDIKKLIIQPEDEFMVLACDGIWNYMSSEEVVDFVRLRLKDESKKISKICEELFDNCLAPNTMGDGTGCDNMTAVIVRFQAKLLDLPTKIKADETEDVLLAKQAVEADAADASLQKSLKRSASPTTADDNSNEAENANKTKRLKTDVVVAGEADEVEEGSTATTTTTTTNNNNNNNTSNDAAASSSTSAAAVAAGVDSAEQKECDSVSATNEVSST